ncbi:MAG: transposase [Verrucomicrobiota bacterium]
MRQKRLKASKDDEAGYYHCISRVVDRQFVLHDAEKEKFVEFMRLYERFCGVRVVTFCVMTNHFHVLVEVPKRPDAEDLPSEEWLIGHVRRCYGKVRAKQLAFDLELHRKNGAHEQADKMIASYYKRMWDISEFMKTLKQRFTQWFNKRHQRRGTLWEDRFRSVLVQGKSEALAAMAAYIDLNPIRADIVEDPKEYRWCGYGEATSGVRVARFGLKVVGQALSKTYNWHSRNYTELLANYRLVLFGHGTQGQIPGKRHKHGFTKAKAVAESARQGQLGRLEFLKQRLRYFTRGAVLGSREFVNEVFESERHRFGPKRKTGARKLREMGETSLHVLRDVGKTRSVR